MHNLHSSTTPHVVKDKMLAKAELLVRNSGLILATATKVVCTFFEMLYYVEDNFDVDNILAMNHAEKAMNLINSVKNFETKYNVNFLSV